MEVDYFIKNVLFKFIFQDLQDKRRKLEDEMQKELENEKKEERRLELRSKST